MRTLLLAALTGAAALAAPAYADVIQLTPADDWLAVINGEHLPPGTTVVLHGGTYLTPDDVLLNIGHVGTAEAPVTIMAAPGETPVITRNTFGSFDDYFTNLEHNVINMRGAQHVVLQGLEVTGGNWGIRIGAKTDWAFSTFELPMGDILRPAHHVTIRGCHIHHTHNTALSANFRGEVYDSIDIIENEIHHAGRWGESIYLGNYDGSVTQGIVKNSRVVRNYLHDNVWENSWYQDPAGPYYHGTAIQLKDGCYNNLIAQNVMHYTFYPAVLVSGAKSVFGDETAPDWGRNVIERNVVWQISKVPGDLTGQGMQVAADAIVRGNIVYAPQPFYTSDHQTLCGDLEIVGNTFIGSTDLLIDTLQIASVPSFPILVANNALYRGPNYPVAITGPGSVSSLVTITGNVTILDLAAALADAPALDFFPVAGSPLIGAANLLHALDVDFNGTVMGGDATVGAYAYDAAGNPGWKVAEGPTIATAVVRAGGLGNPTGFQSSSDPVLGHRWNAAVDVSSPGALGSVLALGLGGPTWGIVLGPDVIGELLVLPPLVFDFAQGSHSIDMPVDPLLLGAQISVQAAVPALTGTRLNNAIDLHLGDY
ncbi:right-handed parallel beta-helix repeat-containing protein [Engelhardtia mirabilis]|uniref:Uncharacterized protein n=1 Tax=Engelhardtia mirabilis TaxID=2528011 RepID=A0A518BRF4_9BACT|nr:hypothetical protein Pla133_46670 [Planctomycetes bacterium Pla133]QDV03873.1 hypothetical protein Pla86_46650 [Planctomycetes bacterium Pla86]